MKRLYHRVKLRLSDAARTAFVGPQLVAFIPALALIGYWFGGEAALVFLAVLVPVVVGLVSMFGPSRAAPESEADLSVAGVPPVTIVRSHLDTAFSKERSSGLRTAALAVEIDGFEQLRRDYGNRAMDAVLRQAVERLHIVLRSGDALGYAGNGRYIIGLAPTWRADLETTLQVAARLQSAFSEAATIDGFRMFLTVSVGFCVPRRKTEKSGETCIAAAEAALQAAQSTGAGAIRAFSDQKARKPSPRSGLASEVAEALEAGQIVPWFQPQLSTDTGLVSGVEALARWEHPTNGVVLPGAFLPAISAAGLTTRLGELMLYHALSAMRSWADRGLEVPTVGVNFSSDDLADPGLFDRVSWELDRFRLAPSSLTIEILEDVIAKRSDDIITRNIARLSELGCKIDLDDFGTGNTSIANIRRFFVDRIKVDRTFVNKVDKDRSQQEMLSAILEMATRLKIDTLAEGVETMGEHAMLAQLGCKHVQGFYIAKAMPTYEAAEWLERRSSTQSACPEIPKKSGT